jgi:hypothetical protein
MPGNPYFVGPSFLATYEPVMPALAVKPMRRTRSRNLGSDRSPENAGSTAISMRSALLSS